MPDTVPEQIEAEYFLGRIKAEKKEYASAKKFFKKYLQKEKHGVWAEGAHYHLIKAISELDDKNIEEEIFKFQKERPNSFYAKDVLYYLIKHYKKIEDYNNAILESEKMIKNFPDAGYTADLKYQIGDFYYKANRKDEAKKYFTELVKKNKNNTEEAAIPQYLLARLYDQDKDYNTARTEYLKVGNKNPGVKNWKIVSDYCYALTFLNEGEEKLDSTVLRFADKKFKDFIKTYPTDKRVPNAWMNIAVIATR